MRAYPSITEIVSHNEAGQRGYGSNHNDPDNWWPRHGYTMGMLRRRVNELLNNSSSTPSPNPTPTKQLYRVRKSWNDAASQIGAYSSLENAKKACKVGYSVFDEKGNVVYSVKENQNQSKVDSAQSFDKSKARTYIVNASVGLHLRAGAGSNKTSLGVLPYGTKVQCFGYYTGEWLYVQTPSGQVGFMHSGYLK